MACASTQNGNLKARSELKALLDSKINIMTYDEALIKLGEPISVIEGKEIFIVTWREEKIRNIIEPRHKKIIVRKVVHGFELRLIFDKITNKMIKWKIKKF